MAYLDMTTLDLPHPARARGKARMLILGAERDSMLNRREIEATAEAYHTQAYIIPGVAHNSMLERNWEAVAARILAWLDEQSGQLPGPANLYEAHSVLAGSPT